MLETFQTRDWNENFSPSLQQEAIESLENGQILFFPELRFELNPSEKRFLSPDYADPHAKNISYHSQQKKLWGVQHLNDHEHCELKELMDRFSQQAFKLIKNLFPRYCEQIIVARTSFRPVEIDGRKTSYRKDDKRLHVDAFPSAPNQGKRILRVFCNINPHGKARTWRVGDSFENMAKQFLPLIKKPMFGKSALLRFLKITKSYRTLYDHYMLYLHDYMKQDEEYQKNAPQQEIHFPPQSTWIVQTDHVSHAAMTGQYVLEQTFYLPVHAMQNELRSPLRVLERMLSTRLV